MDRSINLITAQISFLEGRFALIHIPLLYFPFFLQPIQRLLFGEDHDEDAHKIPWPYRHSFLNFSITPVECSVVCSRDLAERFFQPLCERFNNILPTGERVDRAQISTEDFNVIQVDGQSLDAGQRVLELTSPLALAGISIFFETTYFSDYILVPHKSIHTVKKTLEERGFTFSHSAAAYVSEHSPSSALTPRHAHQSSTGNPYDSPSGQTAPPRTPPAANINELQIQTFAKLRRAGIVPIVDRSIRLVSCAARKETNPSLDAQLRDDLLQILLATSPGTSPSHETDHKIPNLSTRFLSFTLTSEEPISLLLESSLLSHQYLSLSSILLFSQSSVASAPTTLGSRPEKDVLIPITLDLRDLPLEATGIVCGVAGCLAQCTALATPRDAVRQPGSGQGPGGREERSMSPKTGMASTAPRRSGTGLGLTNEYEAEDEAVEISFLSTARAGTVIVRERELERAFKALEAGAKMAEDTVLR